jgi:hypothetical protein
LVYENEEILQKKAEAGKKVGSPDNSERIKKIIEELEEEELEEDELTKEKLINLL